MSANFWSRAAATYDADHSYIVGPDLISAIQSALAEDVPHGDVVEFACGTGLFTRAYAPRCRSVTATDISTPMMAEAKKALGALPNVVVQGADATATGLPGQSADAVVAVNLLHIVPDPPAVLGEAHRLLRPGGVLIAVDATSEGMSVPQLLFSAWRLIRRWGLASGGRNLSLKSLEALLRTAGFTPQEGRLLTGQAMNASYVRGVKPG